MRIKLVPPIISAITIAMFSLSIGTDAIAQSASWTSSWPEIKTMYDDEGDYEMAMGMLDDNLQKLGSDFSDGILTEMLEFLKFYFPGVSSDTAMFERVLFNMLSAARVDRITGAFGGVSSLQTSVDRVKARWQKPTSAKVAATALKLSVGAKTRINVTTYNEKRAKVPATGLKYTISPSGRALWNAQTSEVTARAAGVFSVKVTDASGASLGSVSITVGEPRVVATAEFSLDATTLEVGQTTAYSMVVFDQGKTKIDNPDVKISASPEGAASIDRQSGKVTVLRAGTVSITVTNSKGETVASTQINVLESVSVSLSPDFRELEEGGKTEFTIESNRSIKDAGITWELESAGVVEARETASDKTSIRIEVKSISAGTTALVVKDRGGKRLARSQINVKQALNLPSGPSSRNFLISAGVTVGVGIVALIFNSDANTKFDAYSDCVTLTDPCLDLYSEYADALDKANIVWYVTAAAGIGTAYFGYKYFKAQSNYRKEVDELKNQSRTSFEVGPTSVAVRVSF